MTPVQGLLAIGIALAVAWLLIVVLAAPLDNIRGDDK